MVAGGGQRDIGRQSFFAGEEACLTNQQSPGRRSRRENALGSVAVFQELLLDSPRAPRCASCDRSFLTLFAEALPLRAQPRQAASPRSVASRPPPCSGSRFGIRVAARCSILREGHTWTAVAPEAVFTVRTYGHQPTLRAIPSAQIRFRKARNLQFNAARTSRNPDREPTQEAGDDGARDR